MSDERNGETRLARPSRSGIALVITLILLSVTLVMAVAFLAIARRERNSVTTTTDTATARLAADSALAAAQAQIVANILATTNLGAYNYSLLVSTNYISEPGFQIAPPATYANLTNVSYTYPNGNPVVGNDLVQNIANLYLSPRAPVFVYNRNTGSNDFRFYLDLNRNGQFETNNTPSYTTAGDPEWIGVLEHPDQPHSANNKFVARFAFLAQPVGNGLDLNAVHNQTESSALINPFNAANDGYFRNEGVGTWELNLAAFLADLNTNQWGQIVGSGASAPLGSANYYLYNEPNGVNSGNAFADAQSLLAWRYGYNYNSLAIPSASLISALINAGLDGYTVGNLMTTTFLPVVLNPANQHWAGSDNTNRFFALPSELFNPAQSSGGFTGGFTNRLLNAGSSTNLYDRYTFYRMLDQLGTDSTADDTRMNVNYRNMVNGAVVPGMETNCQVWTPLDFFTNAANLLLQHYTAKWATSYDANHNPVLNQNYVATFNTNAAFGVTHIPVLVSNVFVYTPAVNRLLQLAANMYDATTNDFYPSVFRPTFSVVTQNGFNNVYIDGYEYIASVSGSGDVRLGTVMTLDFMAANSPGHYTGNVYGVPWIVGAKKYLPNFNQFSMQSFTTATRKMQVRRTDTSKYGATATNELFIVSITNHMGFSFWNSYITNYPGGPLTVFLHDTLLMTINMTNSLGLITSWSSATNFFYSPPTPISPWAGSAWSGGNLSANSFVTTNCDFVFLPESMYSYKNNDFSATGWDTNETRVYPFPQIGLATTNWLQAFILDGTRIVDYVILNGPDFSRSMSTVQSPDQDLNDKDITKSGFGSNGKVSFWDSTSNRFNVPYDIVNQFSVSEDPTKYNVTWVTPPDMPAAITKGGSVALEAKYFQAFFLNNGQKNTNYSEQLPYTPTRLARDVVSWQVNDPLVHYMASDLNTTTASTGQSKVDGPASTDYALASIAGLNDRYQPWGRSQQNYPAGLTTSVYDLRYRDSLVWGSDYWDFPTGKLPTVGWLGRVHRGTPWQTVYLKQGDILQDVQTNGPNVGQNLGTNTWAQWTGDTQTAFNQQYDAANSAPVSDRDLFDLFTATPSPNATRGTLSINQTHLASWSALFSGVVALENITPVPSSTTTPIITNVVISPAGVDTANAAISYILNNTNSGFEGINATRAAFINPDGVVGTFEHVGDILNTLAYTEKSPFLTGVNPVDSSRLSYDISDELYEWLPQQTLGLLRASSTPRYVIYCYGQTLRPAVNGIVTDNSAGQFGLCTNYQVTAESAARVVLRMDNAKTGAPHIVVESFNVLPPN